MGQCCPPCYPAPQSSRPLLPAPSPLTPGPGTFGESSYPGQWWGWRAQVGWHPGCHLLGKRGKEIAHVVACPPPSAASFDLEAGKLALVPFTSCVTLDDSLYLSELPSSQIWG